MTLFPLLHIFSLAGSGLNSIFVAEAATLGRLLRRDLSAKNTDGEKAVQQGKRLRHRDPEVPSIHESLYEGNATSLAAGTEREGDWSVVGDFREGAGNWRLQGTASIYQCQISPSPSKQSGGPCAYLKFTPDCTQPFSEGWVSVKLDTKPGVDYELIFNAAITEDLDSTGFGALRMELDDQMMRVVVSAIYKDDHVDSFPKSWNTIIVPFQAHKTRTKFEFRDSHGRQCTVVKDFALRVAPKKVLEPEPWKNPKRLMFALQQIGCPNKDIRDIYKDTLEDWYNAAEPGAIQRMWKLCERVRAGFADTNDIHQCCGRDISQCRPVACMPIDRIELYRGERSGHMLWVALGNTIPSQSSTASGAKAARAVDGQLSKTLPEENSCTKTDETESGHAWWHLNLGTEYEVRVVKITAPSNSSAEAPGLAPFMILLGSTVCAKDVFMEAGETKSIPCIGTSGTINISSQAPMTSMEICEVAVRVAVDEVGQDVIEKGCPVELSTDYWQGDGDLLTGVVSLGQHVETKMSLSRPVSVSADMRTLNYMGGCLKLEALSYSLSTADVTQVGSNFGDWDRLPVVTLFLDEKTGEAIDYAPPFNEALRDQPSTKWAPADGFDGGGLSFDGGVSAYLEPLRINLEDDPLDKDFTVTFRVKFDDTKVVREQNLVFYGLLNSKEGNDESSYSWGCSVRPDTPDLFCEFSWGGGFTLSGVIPPTNSFTWYHFALTRSARGSIKVYWQGLKRASNENAQDKQFKGSVPAKGMLAAYKCEKRVGIPLPEVYDFSKPFSLSFDVLAQPEQSKTTGGVLESVGPEGQGLFIQWTQGGYMLFLCKKKMDCMVLGPSVGYKPGMLFRVEISWDGVGVTFMFDGVQQGEYMRSDTGWGMHRPVACQALKQTHWLGEIKEVKFRKICKRVELVQTSCSITGSAYWKPMWLVGHDGGCQPDAGTAVISLFSEPRGKSLEDCKAQCNSDNDCGFIKYNHAAGSEQGGCEGYSAKEVRCEESSNSCFDNGQDKKEDWGCTVYKLVRAGSQDADFLLGLSLNDTMTDCVGRCGQSALPNDPKMFNYATYASDSPFASADSNQCCPGFRFRCDAASTGTCGANDPKFCFLKSTDALFNAGCYGLQTHSPTPQPTPATPLTMPFSSIMTAYLPPGQRVMHVKNASYFVVGNQVLVGKYPNLESKKLVDVDQAAGVLTLETASSFNEGMDIGTPVTKITVNYLGLGYCRDSNNMQSDYALSNKEFWDKDACGKPCLDLFPKCLGFNFIPHTRACYLHFADQAVTDPSDIPGGGFDVNHQASGYGEIAIADREKSYGSCYVLHAAWNRQQSPGVMLKTFEVTSISLRLLTCFELDDGRYCNVTIPGAASAGIAANGNGANNTEIKVQDETGYPSQAAIDIDRAIHCAATPPSAYCYVLKLLSNGGLEKGDAFHAAEVRAMSVAGMEGGKAILCYVDMDSTDYPAVCKVLIANEKTLSSGPPTIVSNTKTGHIKVTSISVDSALVEHSERVDTQTYLTMITMAGQSLSVMGSTPAPGPMLFPATSSLNANPDSAAAGGTSRSFSALEKASVEKAQRTHEIVEPKRVINCYGTSYPGLGGNLECDVLAAHGSQFHIGSPLVLVTDYQYAAMPTAPLDIGKVAICYINEADKGVCRVLKIGSDGESLTKGPEFVVMETVTGVPRFGLTQHYKDEAVFCDNNQEDESGGKCFFLRATGSTLSSVNLDDVTPKDVKLPIPPALVVQAPDLPGFEKTYYLRGFLDMHPFWSDGEESCTEGLECGAHRIYSEQNRWYITNEEKSWHEMTGNRESQQAATAAAEHQAKLKAALGPNWRPYLLAKTNHGSAGSLDLSSKASAIESSGGKIMITWSTTAMPADEDDPDTYENEVYFIVPGEIDAAEGSDKGHLCSDGRFFSKVTVDCVRGNCGIPDQTYTAYTGGGFKRICFDRAYGLVFSTEEHGLCDTERKAPGTGNFQTLYFGDADCSHDNVKAMALWTFGFHQGARSSSASLASQDGDNTASQTHHPTPNPTERERHQMTAADTCVCTECDRSMKECTCNRGVLDSGLVRAAAGVSDYVLCSEHLRCECGLPFDQCACFEGFEVRPKGPTAYETEDTWLALSTRTVGGNLKPEWTTLVDSDMTWEGWFQIITAPTERVALMGSWADNYDNQVFSTESRRRHGTVFLNPDGTLELETNVGQTSAKWEEMGSPVGRVIESTPIVFGAFWYHVAVSWNRDDEKGYLFLDDALIGHVPFKLLAPGATLPQDSLIMDGRLTFGGGSCKSQSAPCTKWATVHTRMSHIRIWHRSFSANEPPYNCHIKKLFPKLAAEFPLSGDLTNYANDDIATLEEVHYVNALNAEYKPVTVMSNWPSDQCASESHCENSEYPHQSFKGKICFKTAAQASALGPDHGAGECDQWCTNDPLFGDGCGDPALKLCSLPPPPDATPEPTPFPTFDPTFSPTYKPWAGCRSDNPIANDVLPDGITGWGRWLGARFIPADMQVMVKDCMFLYHTGVVGKYGCADGSTCYGNTCCKYKGGRVRCPSNYPKMCNLKICSGEHCCEKDSCDERGGERVCMFSFGQTISNKCLRTHHAYGLSEAGSCETAPAVKMHGPNKATIWARFKYEFIENTVKTVEESISSADYCQQMCQQTAGCDFFTYYGPDSEPEDLRNSCFLKQKVECFTPYGNGAAAFDVTSGPKECPEEHVVAASLPPGPPPPPGLSAPSRRRRTSLGMSSLRSSLLQQTNYGRGGEINQQQTAVVAAESAAAAAGITLHDVNHGKSFLEVGNESDVHLDCKASVLDDDVVTKAGPETFAKFRNEVLIEFPAPQRIGKIAVYHYNHAFGCSKMALQFMDQSTWVTACMLNSEEDSRIKQSVVIDWCKHGLPESPTDKIRLLKLGGEECSEDDNWVRLTGVRIYACDGDADEGNETNSSYPLILGGMVGRSDHFVGLMDDVTVFDRELDAQEIWKLYETGVEFHYPQYTRTSLAIASNESEYELAGQMVHCGTEQYRSSTDTPKDCKKWCDGNIDCQGYVTFEHSSCDKCLAYTSNDCSHAHQQPTSCDGKVLAFNKIQACGQEAAGWRRKVKRDDKQCALQDRLGVYTVTTMQECAQKCNLDFHCGVFETQGPTGCATFRRCRHYTDRNDSSVMFNTYTRCKAQRYADMGTVDNRFHTARLDIDSDGGVRYYWDGELLGHAMDSGKTNGRVGFRAECNDIMVRNIHVSSDGQCAMPTHTCTKPLPLKLGMDHWKGTGNGDTGTLYQASEYLESVANFARPIRFTAEVKASSDQCIAAGIFHSTKAVESGYSITLADGMFRMRPGSHEVPIAIAAFSRRNWNTVQIEARNDGKVAFYVNGNRLLEIDDDTRTSGPVFFFSECTGMHIRNVMVYLEAQCHHEKAVGRGKWEPEE